MKAPDRPKILSTILKPQWFYSESPPRAGFGPERRCYMVEEPAWMDKEELRLFSGS
jgi:hypothetical protein